MQIYDDSEDKLWLTKNKFFCTFSVVRGKLSKIPGIYQSILVTSFFQEIEKF